jgi:predicted DNA-binding protein with PD1-like motif
MRIYVLPVLAAAIIVAGCGSQLEQGNLAAASGGQSELDRNEPGSTGGAVSSRFSRIIVIRLKPGTDLLGGLKEAVGKQGIRNAVILSGIGSLTSYRVHVVSNTSFPPEEVFPEAEGPQDLLNVNGYVIDGRVHAHVTFSDDKKGLGGHLEPGTKVFTFAIITLGELEGQASLAKFDSWR